MKCSFLCDVAGCCAPGHVSAPAGGGRSRAIDEGRTVAGLS